MALGGVWYFVTEKTGFCGGTILDEKTILTAAHCYDDCIIDSGKFYIVAGIVDIDDYKSGQKCVSSKLFLNTSRII